MASRAHKEPRAWRVNWQSMGTGDFAWFQATRRNGSAPREGQEVVAAEDYDSLEEQLEGLKEQLEAARETLEQIAGPTLTSHRKTVDQLTDAVKWRQGVARDALVKLDNPLRALAWIERKREDNTARTYTESSVSRTSKPASAPEATTSPANVGDALGSVTPRASGAENSSPATEASERATGTPGRATAQPMSAGATAEGQVSATVTRSEASDPAVRGRALIDLEEQLEALQKERHVQNLEWAISLAESDPLYAEVFRPYFQKIVDALTSYPAKRRDDG